MARTPGQWQAVSGTPHCVELQRRNPSNLLVVLSAIYNVLGRSSRFGLSETGGDWCAKLIPAGFFLPNKKAQESRATLGPLSLYQDSGGHESRLRRTRATEVDAMASMIQLLESVCSLRCL